MNQKDDEQQSKPRKKARGQSRPKARSSANKAKKRAKAAAATNGSQDALTQPVHAATVEEPVTATGNDAPAPLRARGIAKVGDLLNVPSFRKMVIDRLVRKLG